MPGIPQPSRPAYPGVAGTLLLCHTLLSLAFLLAVRAWPDLAKLVRGDDLRAFVLGGVIMQGLFILLPALLVIARTRPPAEDLAGAGARPGSLILAVAAGIPAAVVFQGLNNLLLYLLVRGGVRLPVPTGSAWLSGSELLRQSWPVILLVAAVSMVLPGLIEELFFRGVLLASLSSGGAIWSAVLWQAVAFALFHGDILFLLPPFLAGILLAFIRRRCGSLWPAMLAHITLNLTLIALNPLLPRLTGLYLADGSRQAASLLYASLIATFVAAVALIPLLILIASLNPRRATPGRRLRLFPGDWKFALAIVLQIVTIIISQRS